MFELALANVLAQDEVETELLDLDDGTKFTVMVGVRFFPPTEFVEGCLERLAKPSAYGPN